LDTRDEVDRIAKLVRAAGGKNLEGRKSASITVPATTLSFFEDPDGNKLEICCRESPVIAQ
jgi:predicted lactoylglutathione lyase